MDILSRLHSAEEIRPTELGPQEGTKHVEILVKQAFEKESRRFLKKWTVQITFVDIDPW